jgi:hypothetical protein
MIMTLMMNMALTSPPTKRRSPVGLVMNAR